jgi:hypothetical protein
VCNSSSSSSIPANAAAAAATVTATAAAAEQVATLSPELASSSSSTKAAAEVTHIALAPGGQQLAAGYSDGTVSYSMLWLVDLLLVYTASTYHDLRGYSNTHKQSYSARYASKTGDSKHFNTHLFTSSTRCEALW